MMKIGVKFYAGFRELFGDREKDLELPDGANIQDLLDLLCDSDERRQRILDPSGEVRSRVVILKNGKQIQSLDGVQTSLEAGDTIAMFPPLGGG